MTKKDMQAFVDSWKFVNSNLDDDFIETFNPAELDDCIALIDSWKHFADSEYADGIYAQPLTDGLLVQFLYNVTHYQYAVDNMMADELFYVVAQHYWAKDSLPVSQMEALIH